MDQAKLIKILNLTTSTNDGEALNALRAANRMLVSNNKSWTQMLTQDESKYHKLEVEYRTLVNMFNDLVGKYNIARDALLNRRR